MVREIGAGTLPHDRFRWYFEQNVLYLEDYARALGLILGKAPDGEALDVMSRFATQIVHTELPANRQFLQRLGGDAGSLDPLETMHPAAYAYTRHLLQVAGQGTCAEGLTAVLPCQWSYGELAVHLAAHVPDDAVYADWIAIVRQRCVRPARGREHRPARPSRRQPRTPRSCAGWSGYSPPRCAMRWSSGTWPMRAQLSASDKGIPMVMRAAQIHEDLTLGVDSVATPSPGRGEVLVRIHAAGVCGTDLHILDGMIKPDPYPMTVGHEAAGVVEATGEGVRLTPGTRVAIYNKLFCGACAQCLVGRHNLCDSEPGQLGFNRDGGDADYVVVPERNAVPIPDGVDMATAAVLTCAGMTAVHAAKLSGLRIGETAIVNGIGGVGILVVQAARRAGARVIAVADAPDKVALAHTHGAGDGLVISEPTATTPCPRRCASSPTVAAWMSSSSWWERQHR